jgi:hypothetical protein
VVAAETLRGFDPAASFFAQRCVFAGIRGDQFWLVVVDDLEGLSASSSMSESA